MLRNAILGFLALAALAASAAQAGDVTLWVVDTQDGKVRVIDQASGSILSETQIKQVTTGDDVDAVSGLARDPDTGKIYMAYTIGGVVLPPPDAASFGVMGAPLPSVRYLGVLDLGNASVSNIGTTGTDFTGLSFAGTEDLFGMYDVLGADWLATVNLGTGAPSDLDQMSGSSTYSPIAFNPDDGYMYRAYTNGMAQAFQKFDPYAADASDSEVAGVLTGDSIGQITSLTWDPGGYFLATDTAFKLYRINPIGNVTYVTQIDTTGFPSMAPIIILNPEPASLALYGLGLLGGAFWVRRRRRARAAA